MAANSANPKLEWMYKTGQDLLNREEYLTGRKVDKQFEEITTGENCVEHDVLPASVSRKKNALESHEQVDIIRKQMEDPLMAIKQKEMEARRKILENPVKLKELHRLLKEEKNDDKASSKKSSKKSKKHKKSRSSSSSSSSDSEDLDKLLLEKYKSIKNNANDSDDDANFIEKKFKTLTKELDKMVNTKKKRSSSRSSDRHRKDKRDSRTPPARSQDRRRKESPDRRLDDKRSRDFRRRSRSPEKRRDNRIPSKSRDTKRESPRRQRSRSPRRNRRASPAQNRERNNDSKYRNPSPPRRKAKSPVQKAAPKGSSSDEASPASKRMQFDDSDDERRYNKPRNFGLVSASGEKIALEKKEKVKYYTREELKPAREAPKKQETIHKKRLNSEEMDAIRAEMMKNADWREKDREKIVKRHRESEEKEKMKHEKEFDKGFLNRHMKKAQDQIGSVESRIRSNLNNIQRTGRTMDSNFAKR